MNRLEPGVKALIVPYCPSRWAGLECTILEAPAFGYGMSLVDGKLEPGWWCRIDLPAAGAAPDGGHWAMKTQWLIPIGHDPDEERDVEERAREVAA